MNVDSFSRVVLDRFEFFCGVPDSQLQTLCDLLIRRFGTRWPHMIAANEGNCVAIAAGYHLATGKIPIVYLQNSGIGNAVNPITSLLHPKVYGIPCFFIIGWRGEPGVHDEPQHVFQGELTPNLLNTLEIRTFVVDIKTTEDELHRAMVDLSSFMEKGGSAALLVRKEALQGEVNCCYGNACEMRREEIIRRIVSCSREDVIVSTTGKTSRELFEVREKKGEPHDRDFLTVGSMGHCSSIALGIALQKPDRKVWCIDGDGAALMHMGAMAIIGTSAPPNLVHIVVNNAAHESVGGMPTVADRIDFTKIAQGCGYPLTLLAKDYAALDDALTCARNQHNLTFIEAKAAVGSRKDLGRPTIAANKNKEQFMARLVKKSS